MNYSENKDIFYGSEYAMQIIDKWSAGIPFFMEYEGKIFDAFLFYSDNRQMARFNAIKLLVLVDVKTGEIKNLSNELDSFKIADNFSFTIKMFTDVDEYIDLSHRIQEKYVELRDDIVTSRVVDKNTQNQYLDIVEKLIPQEIIEKVYRLLSPQLFMKL